MRVVNIYEAKTHFSKLVEAVVHGNEIIIAMAGKPVAKLVPISKKPKRRFGVLKVKLKLLKTSMNHYWMNFLLILRHNHVIAFLISISFFGVSKAILGFPNQFGQKFYMLQKSM